MGCTESKEENPNAVADKGTQGGTELAPPPAKAAHADPKPTSAASGGGDAPSPESKKSAGKLLDKYVLGKLLGQGAFGVVYKCRKKDSKQDYAVKMIDQVETPLAEIKKEVQMLEELKHETVIALHEVFYEKVFVCMVLELYQGGDMIQGMMAHWKKKGMVPMAAVVRLTRQMWDSIAFLHSKSYVHRDVKGDNFMMDIPEVEHPDQRVYLSDFGTVVYLKPGERKKEKCGTKNYWSPEFYKQNYGLKVDCWAVGVIMFGFFSGKFPFKNEQEVNKKKLQIHARVGKEGEELIKWAFHVDENKRCDATEAMRHKFVNPDGVPPPVAEASEQKPLENTDFKDTGADNGVAERRRELLDRMLKSSKNQQGGLPGFDRQATSVQVLQIGEDGYSVQDKSSNRTMIFKWTKVKDAKNLVQQMEAAPSVKTGAVNNDVSTQVIQRQLKRHNIDMSKFGTGQAKPVQEFIDEVQAGKAKLLIDATKPKFLVRAVEAVLLRIYINTPQGKLYCIEKQEKYPDGRVRDSNQLPGHKRAPHENVSQAAIRLVQELMQMQDARIDFDFNNIDRVEEAEESPSYPGVHTVYIKQTVTGCATVTDPAILKQVGLAEGTGENSTFEVQDTQNYTRVFQWMTEQKAIASGVVLRPRMKEGEISALVHPPVGLNSEDLGQYLIDNAVDTTNWGQGTARSVEEFSSELVTGESALLKQDSGRIVRVVDIVVLKLVKTLDDGHECVLREIEEKMNDKTSTLDRLPAQKRRADEHPFAAARRMIAKYLHLDNNTVTLDPTDVKVSQEENSSTSYPGLVSLYRKHYVKGSVHELPASKLNSLAS